MFLLKLGQFAGQHSLNSLADRSGIAPEVDIDTDLVETHQRAQAHAAGNELVDTVAGQMLYWRHTASLLMGHIWQEADIQDLAVFHSYNGVQITVAEVGT
jgi:hypothetical protein